MESSDECSWMSEGGKRMRRLVDPVGDRLIRDPAFGRIVAEALILAEHLLNDVLALAGLERGQRLEGVRWRRVHGGDVRQQLSPCQEHAALAAGRGDEQHGADAPAKG